jgi:hypothetical protein
MCGGKKSVRRYLFIFYFYFTCSSRSCRSPVCARDSGDGDREMKEKKNGSSTTGFYFDIYIYI